MTPVGRLRVARQAAKRRRYGYAALRVLRRGLKAAVANHVARSIGDRPYVSQLADLRADYQRALRDHLKRFGRLDLSDPRAAP